MSSAAAWRPAGVDALTLVFGEQMSETVSARLLGVYRHLSEHPLPGIIDLIPSYTTLYVRFDLHRHTHEALAEKLFVLAEGAARHTGIPDRLVEIPVWYDPHVGPDLERIAQEHDLSIDEVIAIHSAREYRVYAIGFAPGFGYLGEVDRRIATPRLATPRLKIPAGSVALANAQTAVYPSDSPGGWNLLGRTPVTMFDPEREGFSLLRPGDRVRFVPVSYEVYRDGGGVL
jgi:KipI family sensor histidine kinase inhibitor